MINKISKEILKMSLSLLVLVVAFVFIMNTWISYQLYFNFIENAEKQVMALSQRSNELASKTNALVYELIQTKKPELIQIVNKYFPKK